MHRLVSCYPYSNLIGILDANLALLETRSISIVENLREPKVGIMTHDKGNLQL